MRDDDTLLATEQRVSRLVADLPVREPVVVPGLTPVAVAGDRVGGRHRPGDVGLRGGGDDGLGHQMPPPLALAIEIPLCGMIVRPTPSTKRGSALPYVGPVRRPDDNCVCGPVFLAPTLRFAPGALVFMPTV